MGLKVDTPELRLIKDAVLVLSVIRDRNPGAAIAFDEFERKGGDLKQLINKLYDYVPITFIPNGHGDVMRCTCKNPPLNIADFAQHERKCPLHPDHNQAATITQCTCKEQFPMHEKACPLHRPLDHSQRK